MRRITTFRSTTDRIHEGGPIILQYILYIKYIIHIIYYNIMVYYYNTYHCVTIAYGIHYCNSTVL